MLLQEWIWVELLRRRSGIGLDILSFLSGSCVPKGIIIGSCGFLFVPVYHCIKRGAELHVGIFVKWSLKLSYVNGN
jgi:hypothetical protein